MLDHYKVNINEIFDIMKNRYPELDDKIIESMIVAGIESADTALSLVSNMRTSGSIKYENSVYFRVFI